MAKEFKSLKSFLTQINKVVESYDRRENNLLTIVGRFIELESKSIIGHRQYGINGAGFGVWPDLADSTKEDKERKGFGNAGNDWQPLLRTGEMRDSITFTTGKHEVSIGSPSDILVYQELGTEFIPPRPVLSLAMYREKVKMQKAIGNFMMAWITDTRAQGKIT